MNETLECLIFSVESEGSPSPQRSPTLWPTPCQRDHHPNGEAEGSKNDLGNIVLHHSPTPRSSPSPAPSITATFPIRSALVESRTSRVIRYLSDAVLSRMLSAGASHASRTHAPGSDSPAQTSETSGGNVGVFLGTFDPGSHCSRTSAACLQASQGFFSTAFLATWPRYGTLANGRLYQQAPLAPRIEETESGCSAGTSWPTPTSAEGSKIGSQPNYGQQGLSNYPAIVGEVTREKGVKSGQPSPATGPADLASHSTGGSSRGWLTPKCPSGGGMNERTTPGGGLRKLEDQTEGKQGGKLCAAWVLSLMGFPNGWTEVQNSPCKSHKTMGYCSSKGDHHGKTKTARRKEELRLLQETDGAEEVRSAVGGQDCVSSPTILQPSMLGKSSHGDKPITANTDEEGSSACGNPVPRLRKHGEPIRSPHEWGQDKQLSREHQDALFCVSHEMALAEREGRTWSSTMQNLRDALSKVWYVSEASSAVQEVWRSLADEEKKWVAVHIGSRIFDGLNRNRVAQLKAAGNAIVPEVAASLMLAILRVYDMEGKTNKEGGQ